LARLEALSGEVQSANPHRADLEVIGLRFDVLKLKKSVVIRQDRARALQGRAFTNDCGVGNGIVIHTTTVPTGFSGCGLGASDKEV